MLDKSVNYVDRQYDLWMNFKHMRIRIKMLFFLKINLLVQKCLATLQVKDESLK